MQYYVYRKSKNIKDILYRGIPHLGSNSNLFNLSNDISIEKRNVIVASANDENTWSLKSKTTKLVMVVSRVPDINKEEEKWTQFFTNICLSDAIACTSFIHNKLSSFSFPEKLHINLDNCSLPFNKRIPISLGSTTNIFCLDDEPNKLWEFLNRHNEEFNIKIVENYEEAHLGLAMYPICPLQARYWSNILDLVSVGSDNSTNHFYDSRQLHNMNIKLGQTIETIPSSSQPIINSVKSHINEITGLVKYVRNCKPELGIVNYKGMSIFDRIFHEINRSRD